MNIVIPEEYHVGGQTVKVKCVDTLDGKLGNCCVAAGYVNIANKFNGEIQSETSKINTFFHELTHSILDTMGKSELSEDENFVCVFSSFLSEALRSFVYGDTVGLNVDTSKKRLADITDKQEFVDELSKQLEYIVNSAAKMFPDENVEWEYPTGSILIRFKRENNETV